MSASVPVTFSAASPNTAISPASSTRTKESEMAGQKRRRTFPDARIQTRSVLGARTRTRPCGRTRRMTITQKKTNASRNGRNSSGSAA